jgi:hypothetical protein
MLTNRKEVGRHLSASAALVKGKRRVAGAALADAWMAMQNS